MGSFEEYYNEILEKISNGTEIAQTPDKQSNSLLFSNQNLKDSDAQHIAESFNSSTVFSGPLHLAHNALTDHGVLHIAKILDHLTELDLGCNDLRDKSGVYIGSALAKNSTLISLGLEEANMETLGVQRVVECLKNNTTLKTLKIGKVSDSGLKVLATHLVQNTTLLHLSIEEATVSWTGPAIGEFLGALRENTTLLSCAVTSDNTAVVGQVHSIIEKNRELYIKNLAHEQKEYDEMSLDPNDPEQILQYMPMRVYLQEHLKTLLNDGLYALAKQRAQEANPNTNTAINNIKWLAKYIQDNS